METECENRENICPSEGGTTVWVTDSSEVTDYVGSEGETWILSLKQATYACDRETFPSLESAYYDWVICFPS